MAIAENAGSIPEIVSEKISKRIKSKIGFNAAGGRFENMRDSNIIDPHLVVLSSLQHAVSVACNILLVGCSVSLSGGETENIGLIEKI